MWSVVELSCVLLRPMCLLGRRVTVRCAGSQIGIEDKPAFGWQPEGGLVGPVWRWGVHGRTLPLPGPRYLGVLRDLRDSCAEIPPPWPGDDTHACRGRRSSAPEGLSSLSATTAHDLAPPPLFHLCRQDLIPGHLVDRLFTANPRPVLLFRLVFFPDENPVAMVGSCDHAKITIHANVPMPGAVPVTVCVPARSAG